jgi:hypothetical protein
MNDKTVTLVRQAIFTVLDEREWNFENDEQRVDFADRVASFIPSETKCIEIEEGFTYWTHEGHIMRRHYTGSQFDAIEALGPGGWTEVP